MLIDICKIHAIETKPLNVVRTPNEEGSEVVEDGAYNLFLHKVPPGVYFEIRAKCDDDISN
jgi:hypothetical protein